jgi:nifR3 family TIM-barrel protein
MVRIGPIEISAPFCQAGLAGYSDRAMRVVARRRGCAYAVTEALLDTILVNGGQGLRRSIDIDDEDHPIAGQIIGSDPQTMSAAAKILHEHGYDVIDLNFACPVKKIRNKARGGHMLMDVPRAVSILRSVRDALPAGAAISVSLRRGFDDSQESLEQFHRIMETIWSLDYAAVRVHGRTVEQKYLGPSRRSFLEYARKCWPTRTLLGSGDVFTAQDAVRMLKETGVDVVWIARGAIGNPWIFRDAMRLLAAHESGNATPALQPPSIAEQREALREHFAIAMQIHGEQLAGRRMRKMGIKYSRFHPDAARVKKRFIEVRSLGDWTGVLESHYAGDGPGVWAAADAVDEVNDQGRACEAEAVGAL